MLDDNDRQRSVRSDAMPENAAYDDTGCRIHPSCLACPLARCIYDVADTKQAIQQSRNAEILRLHKSGMSMIEIGKRYGIARQTVHSVVTRRKRSRHAAR